MLCFLKLTYNVLLYLVELRLKLKLKYLVFIIELQNNKFLSKRLKVTVQKMQKGKDKKLKDRKSNVLNSEQ